MEPAEPSAVALTPAITEPTTAPPTTPSVAEPAAPPPAPLPTMREALEAAASDLRRCSERAGGLLLIEFETAAARPEFARVFIHGQADDDVRRCVDEATRSLRFEPTDAQTFTEEYTP